MKPRSAPSPCQAFRASLPVALGAIALLPQLAAAQSQPLPSRSAAVDVDSGILRHTGDRPEIVWASVVQIPEATWLRLSFQTAALADDPRSGEGSTLIITSLLDGGTQHLNPTTMRQWHDTSAYFNGDAVSIELLAAPNGRGNRIVIEQVTAGVPVGEGINSICFGVDDRVLSNDPRAARLLPIGCTGWLFNDGAHCFLTAGHCSGSNLQVVEFNVPLSNSQGGLNHPPPEDQYSVELASKQNNGGQGIGDDWGYFGVLPNPVTGLTPYEAQGDAYTLGLPPQVNGQVIRITGYGTTGNGVPREWNQVQKTHVGPYFRFTNTPPNVSRLEYQTDTTGGNSGSPVILESTGEAIGIHTHGGCSSTQGNSGTGSNHAGLRAALASPRGVCIAGLSFGYPDGRPDVVETAGGTRMRVEVTARGAVQPRPATGKLHYDIGAGFVAVPMEIVSNNVYDAVFLAASCGTRVRWYVSSETTSGGTYADPQNAPREFYQAVYADVIGLLMADDFEQDLGWTVVNQNLAAGAWVRAVPAGGGTRGDPLDDYDGSGRCFVTGNAVNEDVDGGPTILTSPLIDLGAETDPLIRYARWFTSTSGALVDRLLVEISNNDGFDWTLVENVAHSTGWIERSFYVADYVTPTAQVRVRFRVADSPDDSTTEAAIDAFQITSTGCGGCEPCDANCDGQINAFDIEPFIGVIFFGDPPCSPCAGDANRDGSRNSFDIEPFVDCLFP